MSKKGLLSLIVPCYNEDKVLGIFYTETCAVLDAIAGYDFEFIFVSDGSTDGTVAMIKDFAKTDPRVRYISFSKNFGKEAAIYAGLKNATGDRVVIMDADMQDPPSLLPEMIDALDKEGFDSAATRRLDRKGEPRLRSWFAVRFYKLINRISHADIVDGARDYRMMSRQYVDAVLSMSEYHRFSKGIFGWVGFDTKWIGFENVARAGGDTKWSFWKLVKYAIEGIVAFTTVPLRLASVLGLFLSIFAGIYTLYFVVRTIIFGNPVAGYPSLLSIVLFLGGIQLLSIGFIGEYISRTYIEVKHRPIYITKETNVSEPKNSKDET